MVARVLVVIGLRRRELESRAASSGLAVSAGRRRERVR